MAQRTSSRSFKPTPKAKDALSSQEFDDLLEAAEEEATPLRSNICYRCGEERPLDMVHAMNFECTKGPQEDCGCFCGKNYNLCEECANCKIFSRVHSDNKKP